MLREIESDSLGVARGGGLTWGPGLTLFFLILVIILTLTFESLHGVGNGSILRLSLTISLILVAVIAADLLLLGIGVSEHEEIDHDFPGLVTSEIATELLNLTGEEPEHVGDGLLGFVVGGDGNINPVKGGVGVAKGNNGDVHVGSLSEGLMVEAGVAHNNESRLEVLLGVLVSKSTWDPLATHVVGASVCGELEDGSLGVLTGRDNKDILLVLGLDSSDDSSGNHGLLPSLGQIVVEDTIPVAIVHVLGHLRVAVLGSNVHL